MLYTHGAEELRIRLCDTTQSTHCVLSSLAKEEKGIATAVVVVAADWSLILVASRHLFGD